MTPALELAELHKRFGAVVALAGASLRVRPGTVHALLGENGAGKSTLMRIAFGMLPPDHGRVRVQGTDVRFGSSADALARGIGMVHQHFTLVPAMTVAENVALGMRGPFDARATAARVRELAQRAGLPLDPAARVDTLPVGAQQRLEIVKALARDVRLLILDEPTAVLMPHEVDELLRWIRQFADDGRAVVLITHKLREALTVADDVTVLHRGRTVRSAGVGDLSEADLVAALLGERTVPNDILPLAAAGTLASHGAVVARLTGVHVSAAHGSAALHDVSLEVRAGEIVGIAAVEGSGQRELLRLLAGRLAPSTGTVAVPPDVAFVPEDRHHDAMVLEMSLTENVALHGLARQRGRMPWRALGMRTQALMAEFDVRAPGTGSLGRSLSGGNQQKLVLARELAAIRGHSPTATIAPPPQDAAPRLVVVENPTRGLDIRATAAVQGQLRRARDGGCAVVLYSSDLDEVLALADRMLVVHAGRLVAVTPATRETVGRAMLGAR